MTRSQATSAQGGGKLYWRYGPMNCGKSTALLQVAYNYEELGMKILLLKPAIDTKGNSLIVSRLGASRPVDLLVSPDLELEPVLLAHMAKRGIVDCVLVDEAQFLTRDQVGSLYRFALGQNIPVMCFGLRTDFQTRLFPGAARLAELAHSQTEIKTLCRCGRKAQFNARKIDDRFVAEGNQIAIDGEQSVAYESMCGRCYMKRVGPIN